jgi:hypothetical protein
MKLTTVGLRDAGRRLLVTKIDIGKPVEDLRPIVCVHLRDVIHVAMDAHLK